MKDKIKQLLEDSIITHQHVLDKEIKNIQTITQLCINCLKERGKIIFCGNGGSAADSQHLAAELIVRFKKDRKSLPALALTTNTSILTAIGNDFGYDKIFERQLESSANKKDILIAFSTSGKSKNIINAIKKAKQMGIKTVAFTGKNGRIFANLCECSFIAPSIDTARIQEAHICVGHIICELIEENLG